MNASLIAIYMRLDSSGLELSFLEALVQDGGFELRNPQSGNITLINDEGEFCITEYSTVAARVHQRQDTQLQFWQVDFVGKHPPDLYCRVVFKGEVAVVEFGELPRDSDALLKGVWAISRARLDNDQVLGFVVDRRGVTEEYADWDALFLEGNAYDGPCPDILCIKKGQEHLLPETCTSHHRCTQSHHIILFDGKIGRILQGCL